MGDLRLSFGIGKVTATAAALSDHIEGPVVSACFGLPAGITCPGMGDCSVFCYAQGGRYRFPNVANARLRNFAAVKRALRAGTAAQELANMTIAWLQDSPWQAAYLLRLHDSGDFFSQSYSNAWHDAICLAGKWMKSRSQYKNAPLIAYGYTKSYAAGITSPVNARVVQSAGSNDDSLIDWRRPVAVTLPVGHDGRGFEIDDKTDMPAVTAVGAARIGLRFHGKRGRNSVPLVQIGKV
jgi:hypothetical protein